MDYAVHPHLSWCSTRCTALHWTTGAVASGSDPRPINHLGRAGGKMGANPCSQIPQNTVEAVNPHGFKVRCLTVACGSYASAHIQKHMKSCHAFQDDKTIFKNLF